MPAPDNAPLAATAPELVSQLEDARLRTLQLVDDLTDDQLEVPQLECVNPFRWELGHVAFFQDLFILGELGAKRFLLDDAEQFYDSFRVAHARRWQLPLPSRQATIDYLERTLAAVVDRLASAGDGRAIELARLALLHEDMHGEAFATMRSTLCYKAPGNRAGPEEIDAGPCPGEVEIPGGSFRLGAEPGPWFVFDNEMWAHPVEVRPFRIDRAPVTRGAFAEFVADRGYEKPAHWSLEGRVWLEQTGARHPACWQQDGDSWLCREFDTLTPLREHAPVDRISWFEAEAFCHWASRRLPTEAEWEMAASCEPDGKGGVRSGRKRRFPWGDDPPDRQRAWLDGRGTSCLDVRALPRGDSAFGLRQMLGNVWEWTADPFYPYPGFEVGRPYREYSAPWFGDRRVLRGGAWPSRSRLVHNMLRNFCQPHRTDQFTGFRTCALA